MENQASYSVSHNFCIPLTTFLKLNEQLLFSMEAWESKRQRFRTKRSIEKCNPYPGSTGDEKTETCLSTHKMFSCTETYFSKSKQQQASSNYSDTWMFLIHFIEENSPRNHWWRKKAMIGLIQLHIFRPGEMRILFSLQKQATKRMLSDLHWKGHQWKV